MRLTMRVVVSQHPPVVVTRHEVIDEREIVSRHFTPIIHPDLFTNQT